MKNEIKQFIGVAVCKFRKSVLQRLEEVRIKNLTINPYLPSVVCGSPKEAIKYSLNGFMGKSNQTKFGSLFEDISIKYWKACRKCYQIYAKRRKGRDL